VAANRHPGNQVSKFHMPTDNCVPKFPLGVIASSTSTSQYSRKFQQITQSRKPRQAPIYFTTLLSFHPSRIQIYYSQIRTTRPTPPAKLPYKKYVSNYHMLELFRSHGIGACKFAPSDIVEILSACTTFALSLSLLPLSHSSQPPQLHPGLQ
jgi:hypothetical protein